VCMFDFDQVTRTAIVPTTFGIATRIAKTVVRTTLVSWRLPQAASRPPDSAAPQDGVPNVCARWEPAWLAAKDRHDISHRPGLRRPAP